MSDPEKNHLKIVASNSFWNIVNYAITFILSFAASIILARYLQPQRFGVYSFIITLTTVAALFLDLGIGQSLYKYIPRYFNDTENRGLAVKIFVKSTYIKILASIFFVIIASSTVGYWSHWININYSNMKLSLVLVLAGTIFTVLGSQMLTYLGATQNFRKIALMSLIGNILNISVVAVLFALRADLFYIVLLPAINGVFTCVLAFYLIRPLLKCQTKPVKKVDTMDVISYTKWAYLNSIVQFILFSYSEVFFLSKYAPSSEIAFYTIPYNLTIMIASLLGMAQRSLFNTQYEVIETEGEEKADRMAYVAIKYGLMIFLPFCSICAYLLKDIAAIVYGVSYLKIQYIFPFLIFSAIIGTVFTPLYTKINNNNNKYSMLILIISAGAVINLTMNWILIPRYFSIGGAIANFSSQVVTTLMLVAYAVSHASNKLNVSLLKKIFIANLLLGIILLASLYLSPDTLLKIAFVIFLLVAYTCYLFIGNILNKKEDNEIVRNIDSFAPRPMKSFTGLLLKALSR